jgi:magnesium transporter
VHAESVGQDGLDDVAVTHRDVDRIVAEFSIPVPDGGHGSVLHRRHCLTLWTREDRGAGVCLHDTPHRLLGELLERATGPVSVLALADARIDVLSQFLRLVGGDDIGGLPGALQGRGDDGGKWQRREPLGNGLGLRLPKIVEEDTWSPAGQNPVGIGLGPSMAHENEGCHDDERKRGCPMQHNGHMIRGLGLYSDTGVTDVADVRNWEMPGDTPVQAKLEELKASCAAHPGAFVWVGLFEPTRDELQIVAEVFDLPHLQVEDAGNDAQRPKMELNDDGHAFVVVKALDYIEASSDVKTGQVAIFIGPWYAVTVRFGQIGDLRGIRQRLEDTPNLRAHGPLSVLYSVLDKTVDRYLEVTDEIAVDIETVETEVFSGNPTASNANTIYRLKRENVEIRRAITPLVPFAHTFVSEDMPWLPSDLRPYFRDIGEHLLRATDTTESSDNLLMTMLMASTSLQDLQQNRDMRKISSWVAIAAVPTMIAGIYGMNFDYMPELHQPWGYPAILTLMGVACFSMFRAFKRSGWL